MSAIFLITNLLNLKTQKIVALVLHIGNLEFIEDEELTSKGGCKVLDNESLELVRFPLNYFLDSFLWNY